MSAAGAVALALLCLAALAALGWMVRDERRWARAQRRSDRQGQRYHREISAARAAGREETALAIERERAEWQTMGALADELPPGWRRGGEA